MSHCIIPIDSTTAVQTICPVLTDNITLHMDNGSSLILWHGTWQTLLNCISSVIGGGGGGGTDSQTLTYNATTGALAISNGNSVFVSREREEYFSNLTSGVNIPLISAPTRPPFVFRNGRYQRVGVDYTYAGTTITFTLLFGFSGGGTPPEEVIVRYNY